METTLTPTIIDMLVIIVIIFGVFLILRELMCWYWKINKIVGLLNDQIKYQQESVLLIKELIGYQKNKSSADSKTSEKNINSISFEEWRKINIGKTLNDYYQAMNK